MTEGERFEQVERLYHLALEKEPEQRTEFLRNACGNDEGLLKDVQSLLVREEHAHDFLEEPALEIAAEALAQEPPSLVGRRLGPYDILGLLGAGGMGEVYRAQTRGQAITNAEHRPKSHQAHLEWIPLRIVKWAENIGPHTARLFERILADKPHPEMGYRSCLGIIRLAGQYSVARMEATAERALLTTTIRMQN